VDGAYRCIRPLLGLGRRWQLGPLPGCQATCLTTSASALPLALREHGVGPVGIPLPPLAVEVNAAPITRRRRKPVPAPRPIGATDPPRTSVPAKAFPAAAPSATAWAVPRSPRAVPLAAVPR
jgi:hypothetical protein